MKTAFFIMVSCLGLLISTHSFGYSMELDTRDEQGGYCSECQCTDRGYYYNNCMTKKQYCETFGNIGMR